MVCQERYYAPRSHTAWEEAPEEEEVRRQNGKGTGEKFASYDWMFQSILEAREDEYADAVRDSQVYTVGEAYAMGNSESMGESEAKKGERRFRLFVYLVFAGWCWKLKKFQISFANLIIKGMAKNVIGGEAFATIGQRIMNEYGWKRLVSEVVAGMAPRRFGKTVVISVVQCSYAVVMEGKVQSTFSTGGRASGAIRDYVRKTFEVSGYGDMLITKGANNETLLVQTVWKEGEPSTLNFFPANGVIRASLSPPPS